MEAFMNYYGSPAFLGMQFFTFPIIVTIMSVLLTFLFRKITISVVVIFLIFAPFFLYAYSQFIVSYELFLIPLILYILIAYFVGKRTIKFISRS